MPKPQITESDRKTQLVLAITVFSAVLLQFVVRVVKGNYFNSAFSALLVAAILMAATASLVSFLKGYSQARRLVPVTSENETLKVQLPGLILNALSAQWRR